MVISIMNHLKLSRRLIKKKHDDRVIDFDIKLPDSDIKANTHRKPDDVAKNVAEIIKEDETMLGEILNEDET